MGEGAPTTTDDDDEKKKKTKKKTKEDEEERSDDDDSDEEEGFHRMGSFFVRPDAENLSEEDQYYEVDENSKLKDLWLKKRQINHQKGSEASYICGFSLGSNDVSLISEFDHVKCNHGKVGMLCLSLKDNLSVK